jgi:hypothetical protein
MKEWHSRQTGDFNCLLLAPNEKSEREAKEMKEWHSRQTGDFNCLQEMLAYCLQDVRVLLSAVQIQIKTDGILFGFDGMAETCTIAGKACYF